VATTITDPFIAEVLQSVESTAHSHGYSVLWASSHAEPEREIAAVEMLHSKRVDGVIVTSSRIGALYQQHLDRLHVPVVLINSHSEQRGPYTFSVSVDNHQGGYAAARHLIELDHRRIAYVCGPADHSDDLARLAGYRDALSEAGIAFDPALVIPGTGRAGGGERALPVLLDASDPATAVFCYNDMTAIGLLRAARREGISVPGDLAVVGFDDIPLASYVAPSLTTIAQPKGPMGRRAAQMVLALLSESGDAARSVSNITVQGSLVVRESSGGMVLPMERKEPIPLEVCR
jgi:DNA-binding LacI/PurR family transcriptional regulator